MRVETASMVVYRRSERAYRPTQDVPKSGRDGATGEAIRRGGRNAKSTRERNAGFGAFRCRWLWVRKRLRSLDATVDGEEHGARLEEQQ